MTLQSFVIISYNDRHRKPRALATAEGGHKVPNPSKINDPRFWNRWRAAGAVAMVVKEVKRRLRPPVAIPQPDRSRSDEMAGFGMLLGALFGGRSGGDGDIGESFPKSDADDFARGARFVPGEVTLARRRGEKVKFNASCTSACCWYWEMKDGSRIYHYDPMVHDFLTKNHSSGCPRCGNTHVNGGTISAAEVQATQPPAAGAYKTDFTEEVIEDHSDRVNLTGYSPRTLLRRQEEVQCAAAQNPKWLVARRINPRGDSRDPLEQLGFKVVGEHDDLFYEVQPPTGWTKDTSGYWTTIKDAAGTERISQFFKGAIYDRDAFMNLRMA